MMKYKKDNFKMVNYMGLAGLYIAMDSTTLESMLTVKWREWDTISMSMAQPMLACLSEIILLRIRGLEIEFSKWEVEKPVKMKIVILKMNRVTKMKNGENNLNLILSNQSFFFI